MDTTFRPTSSGASATIGGVRGGDSARLLPARRADTPAADEARAAAPVAPAPLKRSAGSIGGALQDGVARAQQALDYLERVASQLENLKGELSARLAGSRKGQGARAQVDTQVRQLAATLAARSRDGGAGLDADLNFSGQPAVQRFRMRGIELDTLQQGAPQSIAFSVGGIGGPQLAASITPDQTTEQSVRAIDRALAPLGVRAGLDGNGGLLFATPEANWPAVRDSVAVSGRGRVSTEEVPASIAPQQWDTGNIDSLRQSLREVVQALERVRRSQDAASNALSSASLEVAQAQTPAPDVEIAADDFAGAAAGTDYQSLLALSSALVGVSRERVLALLGLR